MIRRRRLLSLVTIGAAVAMAAAGCVSSGGGGAAVVRRPQARAGRPPRRCRRAVGMDALVAAASKEGTLNVIALPPDWANYGDIIKAFTTKYGIKVNWRTRTAPARTRSTPSSSSRARTARPTCSTSASPSRIRRKDGAVRALQGGHLGHDPRRQKDAERRLVQRLRRLHLDRLRRQDRPGLPDDVRRPAQARVQGQGRAQRRPDQGRRRVRRRLRGRRWPTAAASTTSSPASTSSAS